MEELYTRTMEREKYFISQVYNIVTIWECELSKEVKKFKIRFIFSFVI